MNAIPKKLLLFWLLLLGWSVFMFFNHHFIAWLAYGVILLVRPSIPRPKLPVFLERLGMIFAGGFIFFLVLVLIHSYSPFSPFTVKILEIIFVIFVAVTTAPLVIFAVYSDYKLFKKSNGDLNQAP